MIEFLPTYALLSVITVSKCVFSSIYVPENNILFLIVDPCLTVTPGPNTQFSTLPSILHPLLTKEFITLPVAPILTAGKSSLFV